jgi:hypothetical protein
MDRCEISSRKPFLMPQRIEPLSTWLSQGKEDESRAPGSAGGLRGKNGFRRTRPWNEEDAERWLVCSSRRSLGTK